MEPQQCGASLNSSDTSTDGDPSPSKNTGVTRRGALLATGATVFGGVLGFAGSQLTGNRAADTEQQQEQQQSTPSKSEPALVGEDKRAGITWPASPPRHTVVTVCALEGRSAAEVFQAAEAAQAAAPPTETDAQPVTVLVGLGIEVAHELFPDRCAQTAGLPVFASDAETIARGGDLVVMTSAETASGAADASRNALEAVGAHRVLWSQRGFRDAPSPEGTTRTATGFIDGIVNPRTPEELRAGVWAGESGYDTFFAVRKMPISASFTSIPVAEQEAAIGRKKLDGAPLSGGKPLDNVDLLAKRSDGRTLIPQNAHVRRAHPANIGRPLMLRRSYSFDAGSESGLIFVAMLADMQTFVSTQQRMDEADDLLRHTQTVAGDCFFVPQELSAGSSVSTS